MVGQIFPAQNSGLSGSGEVFYPVGAATFDGTTAYLKRESSDLNISSGILSLWFNLNATSGSFNALFCAYLSSPVSYLYALRNGTNNIFIQLVSGAHTFNYTSSTTYVSSGWHHLMTSWNTNLSAGNKVASLYVDGVDVKGSVSDAGSAFTMGSSFNHYVGVNNTTGSVGTQFFKGGLAEVYFNGTQFLDLTILANRRKFLTASKRPAFLGLDGKLPTGSQPQVYLRGSGVGFNVESGSLGNYTTVGALTTPTTTPSNP